METRNSAIIGIWAFMIALLVLTFVERSDFFMVFFLFFVALIVTIYLASASEENRKAQEEFAGKLQDIESKLDVQSKDVEKIKKFIEE